jgi:hypothetical protein
MISVDVSIDTQMNVFPGVAAELTEGSLPEWLSHSRTGGAMMFDSTGKLTWAPENLVTYSEDFSQAIWSKIGSGVGLAPVVTTNAGLAPDGTMTADRMVFDLNGGTTGSDISWFTRNTGITFGTAINSLYVKSYDGVSTYQFVMGTADGGQSALKTIGPTWTRIDARTAASNGAIGLRLRGNAGTSSSADILVWGAQQERVTYETSPRTYNHTTSAAYYGPRFDYDPATLTALGLLLEGTRTNSTSKSQDPADADWQPIGAVKTSTNNSDPLGTSTALLLTADGTSAAHYLIKGNVSVTSYTSGTSYTTSAFVKAGTANRVQLTFGSTRFGTGQYANFYLSGAGSISASAGGTGSIRQLADGWYRISFTAAATVSGSDPAGVLAFLSTGSETRLPTITSAQNVYVSCWQVEAATFASSYIMTTTASVTRASDVCQIIGQGLIPFQSDYGAVFVQFNAAGYEINSVIVGGQLSSANYLYEQSGPQVYTYNGSGSGVGVTGNPVGTFRRYAFTWNKVAPSRRIAATGVAQDGDSNIPFTEGDGTRWLGSRTGTSAFTFGWYQSLASLVGDLTDGEIAAILPLDEPYI